ncbi:unnamed protein product, partial [Effrenium voratum]
GVLYSLVRVPSCQEFVSQRSQTHRSCLAPVSFFHSGAMGCSTSRTDGHAHAHAHAMPVGKRLSAYDLQGVRCTEQEALDFVEPQLSFKSMDCKPDAASPGGLPNSATHQRYAAKLDRYLKRVEGNLVGFEQEVINRTSKMHP